MGGGLRCLGTFDLQKCLQLVLIPSQIFQYTTTEEYFFHDVRNPTLVYLVLLKKHTGRSG